MIRKSPSLVAISTGRQVTTLHTVGTMPSEILSRAMICGQISDDRLEVVDADQDRMARPSVERGARQHVRPDRRLPKQPTHHRCGHIRKVDEVHGNRTAHRGTCGQQTGP